MRKEVEMCGDRWKTENSVLLSIYTPVITSSNCTYSKVLMCGNVVPMERNMRGKYSYQCDLTCEW